MYGGAASEFSLGGDISAREAHGKIRQPPLASGGGNPFLVCGCNFSQKKEIELDFSKGGKYLLVRWEQIFCHNYPKTIVQTKKRPSKGGTEKIMSFLGGQ